MHDMKRYYNKRRGKVVIISLIKVHEVVHLLAHDATHGCTTTRHWVLLLTMVVMIMGIHDIAPCSNRVIVRALIVVVAHLRSRCSVAAD
jgi:hypothetical protein